MKLKKHIITIGGRPGSGKSSTSKRIAADLGYDHFSSGDLFRKSASEQGLDLLTANLSAEQNTAIDHMVDEKLRLIGENEDKKVIDSRTAWHWIPQSFKVFLDLDIDTAAMRIVRTMDEERKMIEHVSDDTHEYALHLQERLDSEARRYMNLYQINPYDMSNYDLVIDTKIHDLDDVIGIIIAQYKEWQES